MLFQTFRVGIPYFPGNRGIPESPESWEYLFLAFHTFPGFSGWYPMLSKKRWNPGKLGIIPAFLRFFAHRGKPGKRGAFLPGFPGFPRLLGVTLLAFQETVESWKARKVRNLLEPRVSAFSWKAKRLLAFLAFSYVQKSVESQEFFRGIPEISWLFLVGEGFENSTSDERSSMQIY